ncbi:hypothetical protein DSO57_1000126 [Entomophthora muscae]|uniref:Uncharacterized protein n=1 Tax=Entomophthora muscae TaxID=34485 RepID=A0ACC2SMH1_9FUNG|nr:hypothetical protein DSO57_1000126 [Entomophthora muscae]
MFRPLRTIHFIISALAALIINKDQVGRCFTSLRMELDQSIRWVEESQKLSTYHYAPQQAHDTVNTGTFWVTHKFVKSYEGDFLKHKGMRIAYLPVQLPSQLRYPQLF